VVRSILSLDVRVCQMRLKRREDSLVVASKTPNHPINRLTDRMNRSSSCIYVVSVRATSDAPTCDLSLLSCTLLNHRNLFTARKTPDGKSRTCSQVTMSSEPTLVRRILIPSLPFLPSLLHSLAPSFHPPYHPNTYHCPPYALGIVLLLFLPPSIPSVVPTPNAPS
jgi:hypothetical protein